MAPSAGSGEYFIDFKGGPEVLLPCGVRDNVPGDNTLRASHRDAIRPTQSGQLVNVDSVWSHSPLSRSVCSSRVTLELTSTTRRMSRKSDLVVDHRRVPALVLVALPKVLVSTVLPIEVIRIKLPT